MFASDNKVPYKSAMQLVKISLYVRKIVIYSEISFRELTRFYFCQYTKHRFTC